MSRRACLIVGGALAAAAVVGCPTVSVWLYAFDVVSEDVAVAAFITATAVALVGGAFWIAAGPDERAR